MSSIMLGTGDRAVKKESLKDCYLHVACISHASLKNLNFYVSVRVASFQII